MKLRQLTAADVTFTIECSPEHIPIEGNALASGDDAIDQACYADLQRQLDQGNEWAWCSVKVEATWESPSGHTFRGAEYLGGCSYESQKDFERDCYCQDMKDRALEDLNESIKYHYKLKVCRRRTFR